VKFSNNLKIDTDIKLLVVEDETFNREYLVKLLSTNYKTIFSASNGQEALGLMEKEKIDILISDIKMPVKDGISLAKDVKDRFPDVLIILLTAYKDVDYLIEAININIDHYITKPVDIDKLINTIEKLKSQVIANKTITAQRRFIEFIVDSTKNLIILIRGNSIIAANKAFLNYYYNRNLKSGEEFSNQYLPLEVKNILNDDVIAALDKQSSPRIIALPSTDGTSRYFSANYAKFDSETSIIYFNDIDSLIKAQQELAQQKQRLEMILENLGEGVIVCDKQGIITFINSFAQKFIKIKIKNTTGMHINNVIEFVDNKGNKSFNPLIASLEKTATYFNNEQMYIKNINKKQIPVDYISSPIIDSEGNVLEAVIIIKDMTYKNLTEESLLRTQKLESIGVLAGGIAHDFNNLLTILYNYIHLAKVYLNEKNKAKEFLVKAENTIDSTRELTEKLLTFSEGGNPKKEQIEIISALKEISDLVFAGSNLKVKIIASEDSYIVEADNNQLKQMFFNVLKNAKEATPDGGTVKVTLEKVTQLDKNYVKISIIDKGKGISKEIKNKIFDPYFTTKEVYSQKGSGLGLSICYSIAKKHGGRISFESEECKGTSFHIFLPL